MKKTWFTILPAIIAFSVISSPAAASGDAADGAKFFKKKCAVCHAVKVGKHKLGPSLAGIVGRKAGTTDFAKYTGLKGSDVVWDEDNLDKFLANPKKFVGAKSMIYKLKKEDDRADVIEYLKTL